MTDEPTKPPAPAKPHCIALRCESTRGIDYTKGKFFCPPHELNVPRHLRKALEAEVLWLNRKSSPFDEHATGLLSLAANREYATRLMKDPVEMAKWQAEKAAAEAERRAKEAGLILPPKAGEFVVTPP